MTTAKVKGAALVGLTIVIAAQTTAAVAGRLDREDPRVRAARHGCSLDLDRDGDCDRRDSGLLSLAVGKCEGTDGYDPAADTDGDRCITRIDQEKWFPMFRSRVSTRICDLDEDGDCDDGDLEIYRQAAGMCFDHPLEQMERNCPECTDMYLPVADANRDGCVSGLDREILTRAASESRDHDRGCRGRTKKRSDSSRGDEKLSGDTR